MSTATKDGGEDVSEAFEGLSTAAGESLRFL